jgi:ribokinase|tara:strand:+ start:4325 stop:5251 length:927 start_codon:yes stop_codon:yes gene_type:complete
MHTFGVKTEKTCTTKKVTNMTIFNLGSINIDHVYMLKRIPKPGETLSALESLTNIGGKGLNISAAAHQAGADVRHIGIISAADPLVLDKILDLGLDCTLISQIDTQTGHAIVYVDENAENTIVIHGGANLHFSEAQIRHALSSARPNDWLILQNETNANEIGISIAREKGMKIALVAAPFDTKEMPEQIKKVDLVSMNKTESELFEAATGASLSQFKSIDFLITYGAEGAMFLSNGIAQRIAAHKVRSVDTTGAGDTFFGVFMTHFINGDGVKIALERANAAAALAVQRTGVAAIAPNKKEIDSFLET